MLGIIPAAGAGSRIQPLAFSKELLPVGGRLDGSIERPRAVSEYLVDRMRVAGTDKICFVIGAGKSDILEYYGSRVYSADVCYAVQQQPAGLCDAIFRALPMVHRDQVVCIGLPDTVWFPESGLCALPDDVLSFLLFPVDHPERFDAVVTDENDRVLEIQVKTENANSVLGSRLRSFARSRSDSSPVWRCPHRVRARRPFPSEAAAAQGRRNARKKSCPEI